MILKVRFRHFLTIHVNIYESQTNTIFSFYWSFAKIKLLLTHVRKTPSLRSRYWTVCLKSGLRNKLPIFFILNLSAWKSFLQINLDLRNIVPTTKILVHKLFDLRKIAKYIRSTFKTDSGGPSTFSFQIFIKKKFRLISWVCFTCTSLPLE